MSALVKYDAARYALQQAVEIDEVKDIRDKAEAMASYARQAKDTDMIRWVTEIKVRAERRAGQMLAEMPKATGKSGQFTGGHTMVPPVKDEKTLAELGITKNESSRWQKLAAIDAEKFEKAVSAAKEVAGEVTTAAMLRIDSKAKAIPGAKLTPKPAPVIEEEEALELRARIEELTAAFRELLDENVSMGAVIDADDRLAALSAENKKLRELNRVLNERLQGLQGECNEAKRAAKMWRAKFDKLEKMAG